MAKKRRSRPKGKNRSRKQSNTGHIVRNTITVIVIIAIIISLLLYLRDNTSPLPFRANNTPAYTGTAVQGHIASLDRAKTPQNRRSQIIEHKGYTVSYNSQWRLPNWVAYELTAEETRGDAERSNRFLVDPKVEGVCPRHNDYTHSGYDRGHMAPAADMTWDEQAMRESFYMSNICPQVHGLNAGAWKQLENKIRIWARRDSAIIVVCGPIVKESHPTIGRNRVAVPDYFYKVVASPYVSQPRGIAFIFRNETAKEPLYTYTVTIDSVEALTGIDFLYNLPDSIEQHIEQNIDLQSWQL